MATEPVEQAPAGIAKHWLDLRIAIQFLTTLPVGKVASRHNETNHSLYWYPLVGLLIGILLVLLGTMLTALPTLLAAVLVTLAWFMLTGGLHLDGLADCADAWMGGLTGKNTEQIKQQTLKIMKDPTCGPMAVIMICAVLLLKVAALEAMFSLTSLVATNAQFSLLMIVPLLSRTLVLPMFVLVPYVSDAGIATTMAQRINNTIAGAIVGAVVFFTLGFSSLYANPASAILLYSTSILTFFVWRSAVIKRLGGFTGDCAGALIELNEALLLLTIVAGFHTFAIASN